MAARATVDVRRPLRLIAAAESIAAPTMDPFGTTVMNMSERHFEFTTDDGAHLAPRPPCLDIYVSEVDPISLVDVVIDNTHFSHPRIIRSA